MDDPTDIHAGDGVFLATASESAERARRVLPDGPSEDARHVLGAAPRSPRPPSEPGSGFAPLETVDWVVTIELPDERRASRAEIDTVFGREWRDANGRPTFFGRSGGRWTFVHAANAPEAFDALELAWDMAPWDGDLLTEANAIAWARAVQAAAHRLAEDARVSTSTPPATAAARARELAAWRNEWDLDAQVLLVAPAGESYDGVEMWDALTSLGLAWGDGDLFHWVNPDLDHGDSYLFSVGTGTPPGYFFPEEAVAGRLHVEDLDFGFSVARACEPLAVFDAMMRAVRYVQRRLGGELVGADGDALDEEAIRANIRGVVESMERAGIPPGSDAALRLL